MIQSFNPPNLSDLQKRAGAVGIVFLIGLIASAFFNPRQFFQSYLIGWTFCTGIAIGSLALLMLQHLTGGGGGLVIRRVLEAATRTLPIMAVLFLPVWFLMQFMNGFLSLASARRTEGVAGVAWWAHVGGFAVGALIGVLFRSRVKATERLPEVP